MRNLRKIYFLAGGTIVALSIIFVWCLFLGDECFLLKPLPPGIPLEIRQDDYGDGHFGAPRQEGERKHNGIDLSAPLNTPVYATKSGLVIKTACNENSGNYVVIWHRSFLKSYYLHLSEIKVIKWQPVKQGWIIGKVGRTGNARHQGIKPHLHFEIRESGVPQDILKRWPKEFFK